MGVLWCKRLFNMDECSTILQIAYGYAVIGSESQLDTIMYIFKTNSTTSRPICLR